MHVVFRRYTPLHRAFTEAGGHWSTFVIWRRNVHDGPFAFQRQYEPMLMGWKEGHGSFLVGAARDQRFGWKRSRSKTICTRR